MKELLAKIKSFAKEGLFHIFGSSVLAQIGGLISSMVVVRRLPKADYGHYVSAHNLYSYLAIFIGLGMTTVVIQYCSERIEDGRRNAIYRYSLTSGMLSNIAVFLLIFALSAAKGFAGDTEVARYLGMMSGLPFVVYLNNYLQMVLRVKRNNHAFSYANMLYAAVILAGNILFVLLFGVVGLIYATYLANAAAALLCFAVLKKDGFFSEAFRKNDALTHKDKKELTSYAVICALTNFTSTMLVLLDVTCLDLVLGDAEVLADYKVAATIPAACLFVPSCLMTFFYPKLVDAFSLGRRNGQREVNRLLRLFLVLNGIVFVCLVLGAPLIILIIFGEKYMNVVWIFEVLSLNYLIYSVRQLLGNVIAVIKRVKINLLFAVISGVLNIILNLILISNFGSMGAAIATVTVTLAVGTMDFIYLQHYYKQPETAKE